MYNEILIRLRLKKKLTVLTRQNRFEENIKPTVDAPFCTSTDCQIIQTDYSYAQYANKLYITIRSNGDERLRL